MRLRSFVPGAVRRHAAWRTLSRLHHEGWTRATQRVRTWRRILRTQPVAIDPPTPGAPVEVHLMCHRPDHLQAFWALKSFYRAADVRYPLVVHLQGRTPALVARRFSRHFPAARIITQREADRLVEPMLAALRHERLAAFRRRNPMLMKLVDFVLLGAAVHVLALDSDVVFFRRPDELLATGTDPMPETLFMHDFASSYNVAPAQARARFGIDLVPRINCGIMLFARASVDLARCDELLGDPAVNRNTGLTEQTLRALLASDAGTVRFLPDTYHLSLHPSPLLDGAVARHYAGSTRRLMVDEGIPRIVRDGLLAGRP